MNIQQAVQQELSYPHETGDLTIRDDRRPMDKLRRNQIKKILRGAGVEHDTKASKDDLMVVLNAALSGRAIEAPQASLPRAKLVSVLTALKKAEKIDDADFTKMSVDEMQAIYDGFMGG